MERKVYEVGIVEGDRLFALMVTDQKKKANLLQTEIISKGKTAFIRALDPWEANRYPLKHFGIKRPWQLLCL